MKTAKPAIKTNDFRVWCTRCFIRVAPQEEQIAVDGQTYHPACYSKHAAATSKPASKRKALQR